jgi:hypothetical protein
VESGEEFQSESDTRRLQGLLTAIRYRMPAGEPTAFEFAGYPGLRANLHPQCLCHQLSRQSHIVPTFGQQIANGYFAIELLLFPL